VNPIYEAMRKFFLLEYAKANDVRFEEKTTLAEPVPEGVVLPYRIEYAFEPGVVMVLGRALCTGEWPHLVGGVGQGLEKIKAWADGIYKNQDRLLGHLLGLGLSSERGYSLEDLTEMLRLLGIVTHPASTSRVAVAYQLTNAVKLILKKPKEDGCSASK